MFTTSSAFLSNVNISHRCRAFKLANWFLKNYRTSKGSGCICHHAAEDALFTGMFTSWTPYIGLCHICFLLFVLVFFFLPFIIAPKC